MTIFRAMMPVRLPAARLGVKMRKALFVAGACTLLSGCALPIPIQVASWAIDIISIATTEKSLADHGLSALTQQDCALYRVVTEADGEICHEVDGRTDVMTAEADQPAAARSLKRAGGRAGGLRFEAIETEVANSQDEAISSGEVQIASAPEPVAVPSAGVDAVAEQPVKVNIDLAALQPMAEEIDRPFMRLAVEGAPVQTVAALPPVDALPKPQAGFYYVIGSFRGSDRAKRHMQTYGMLTPSVLHGRIGTDGREVYRVVVGPFNAQERSVAVRRIKRAGIADSWAIRVSPKDWTVAAKLQPTQQADASAVLRARDWPGLTHFITVR